MAATNVQAFPGDVTIPGNVTAASSKFSFDTNGTSKQEALDGNGRYIKLMKYFSGDSNWKIATGSYASSTWQWINMRVKMARLDGDVKTIQFNFHGNSGNYRVREPMIIGTSASNEVKVYVNTSTETYEIYIQNTSAVTVEVEISHRNSTIDDDYSTVAAGAVSETGLTKIYDSSTTVDFIVKSGNVGIGTTNPARTGLNLYTGGNLISMKSSAGDKPEITMSWSGTNAENFSFYDVHGSGYGFLYGRKYTTGTTANSNAGWKFYGNDNAVGLTIVGTTANVGIGTASPAERLDVGAGGNIRLTNPAYKGVRLSNAIYFHEGGNANELSAPLASIQAHDKYNNSGNYRAQLELRSQGGALVTLGQYSGVGIGTTNPGYGLDVRGTGQFTNSLNVSKDATRSSPGRFSVTSGDTGIRLHMGTGGNGSYASTGIVTGGNNSGGGTILFVFNKNQSGGTATSSQLWVLRKNYSGGWTQDGNTAYLIKALNGSGSGTTVSFRQNNNMLEYIYTNGGNGHFYALEFD